MLPFLLLGAGWYIEWGPGKRPNSGWGLTLVGIAIAYVGFLGAFEILDLTLVGHGARRRPDRPVPGRRRCSRCSPAPGAFVVLLAIGIIGLMLAFNLRLRQVVRPVTGTAKWVGGAAAASMRRDPEPVGPGKAGPTNGNGDEEGAPRPAARRREGRHAARRRRRARPASGAASGRPRRPHPGRRPEHRADVGHVRPGRDRRRDSPRPPRSSRDPPHGPRPSTT